MRGGGRPTRAKRTLLHRRLAILRRRRNPMEPNGTDPFPSSERWRRSRARLITYYAATLPQSLLLQLLLTLFLLSAGAGEGLISAIGLTELAVCCFHVHVKEDAVTQRRDNSSPVAVARFPLFNALMSHPVSSVRSNQRPRNVFDVTFPARLENRPELVLK